MSQAIYLESQQGWEFAQRFSEQITHFLGKNEQMSDSLKKTSNSLIRSYKMSDLSNSLMLLIFGEQLEQTTHGRSFLVSELSSSLTSLTKKEGMSELLFFLINLTYIKHTKK